MKTCDEIHVLMALRPDDRSAGEAGRVRAHVATCAACAARAAAYAEQDRTIRGLPRERLTPAQRHQLLSTVRGEARRREVRARVLNVFGTVATAVAVIGLAVGLRALSRWDGQLIPEEPVDPVSVTTAVDDAEPLPDGGTARIRGVDFAVVEHEMTPCVTLASDEERCAPGGQTYVLVKMGVQNPERYPITAAGPDIRVLYQGRLLPKTVFLPQGKPPRSACTPEGYYEDTLCHFWVGAVAPEGARAAELEVRAEEDGTVYVWPLERPGEVHVSRPGTLVWPTTRREISGWSFHDPRNPDHPGIDIAADEGDPVFAVAEGSVVFAGVAGDYGNLVVVEHSDGWSSYYGQMSEVLVEVDGELEQGELLGRAGSTGDSSGPHLHFELRYAGVAVDPVAYLPSQIPLADWLVGPDELPGTVLESGGPDGWVVRPMEPAGEPDGEDWIGDLAEAEGCMEALRIQGPREVRTSDGSTRVVYVMNTAYRFETVGQAQREYDAVVRRAASHAREQVYASAPSPGMETHTFAFTGQSDDVIYWLVGMRKQDVLLLMVNGLDNAGTRGVFDAAVSRILEMDYGRYVPDQEARLAALFVQDPAAVCGWEVLGEGDGQTYVWAICQSSSGTAVSAPAVLFWSGGDAGVGSLLDVRMPRDGTYYGEDVRQLFPPQVQERIFDRQVDLDGIWEQMESDLETVTGTVVDNAESARVLTLEDARGDQWLVPWSASRGVRWADGAAAQFRDIERGMLVEVVGLQHPQAATPNVLSAVRVTVVDEAFAASEAALAAYEPLSGAEGAVQGLSREIAAWLAAGHDPEMLTDALQALPKLDAADVRVARVDVNGDGLDDVVVEPQFLGLPVLACLAQPGSGFACHSLPDPETLGYETLTVGSAVIPADVMGDSHLETVITYTVQAASGSRELVYVFAWGEVASAPEVVFYVDLQSWAGDSTWELARDPTAAGRQQIVLEYPHFYDLGFDHKLENHPLGRQIWRLDDDLGRFVLADEAVDMTRSAWGAGTEITTEDRLRWLTNEGETAFRTGRYEEALGAYDEVVALAATEGWSPTGDEPDWVGLARLRQGQARAHLGRADEAVNALSAVVRDYEGDLLGELAAAFVAGYGSSASLGSAEAGCNALKALEERVQDHFYRELGGPLRFPMTAGGILSCMP